MQRGLLVDVVKPPVPVHSLKACPEMVAGTESSIDWPRSTPVRGTEDVPTETTAELDGAPEHVALLNFFQARLTVGPLVLTLTLPSVNVVCATRLPAEVTCFAK